MYLKYLAETIRQVQREGKYFTLMGDFDINKAMEQARQAGHTEVEIKRTITRTLEELEAA